MTPPAPRDWHREPRRDWDARCRRPLAGEGWAFLALPSGFKHGGCWAPPAQRGVRGQGLAVLGAAGPDQACGGISCLLCSSFIPCEEAFSSHFLCLSNAVSALPWPC